jgi:hypothetical protein
MAKKDKNKTEEIDAHRQIPSSPSNPELLEFLSDLFWIAPVDVDPGKVKTEFDHFPERLVLRTVSGVGGVETVGPIAHEENFRPMSQAVPKSEVLVALSNRLDRICQREANTAERKLWFTLQAWSEARGSEPYKRMLIKKTPSGKELATALPDESALERTRALDEREQELRDRRFRDMLLMQMIGEHQSAMANLVGMYEKRLSASELANQELMKAHVAVVSLKEDLLDRSADRALKVRRETFREEKIERGFNLLEKFALPAALTHFLGPDRAAMALAMANDASVASPSGAAAHPLVAQLNGLLASLDEKRQIELLGHWDEQERRQASPGIFGPEQVALLASLVSGEAPASRLNELISSLTASQMARAHQLLTEQERAALMAIAIAASNLPSDQTAANGASTVQ